MIFTNQGEGTEQMIVKVKKWGRTSLILLLVCVVTAPALLYGTSRPAAAESASESASTTDSSLLSDMASEPYYQDRLGEWADNGYQDVTDARVEMAAADYAASSPDADVAIDSYEGQDHVLIWKDSRKEEWIEFDLTVDQPGLYQMDFTYHAYADKTSDRTPMDFKLTIDGNYPFREAKTIRFNRIWKDSFPLAIDDNGDQIRSMPEQINQWVTQPVVDRNGGYAEPYRWYLEAGQHTLRLATHQPIVLQSIVLRPPMSTPNYADVSAAYPETPLLKGKPIVIEAEETAAKSSSTILMLPHPDTYNTPQTKGHIIYNTLGGWVWSTDNGTVTWEFETPESGLYKIGARALQTFMRNKISFRQIRIDGELPFKEMENYPFQYRNGWKGVVLADDAGQDYEFYLAKGKHTLSMTTTSAPFTEANVQIQKLVDRLRKVDQDLKRLIGGQADDRNRTWKVGKDFPAAIPEEMASIRDALITVQSSIIQANKGIKDDTAQSVVVSVKDLNRLLANPNEIPNNSEDVTLVFERLADLRGSLEGAPLQLDKLYIIPAGSKLPKMEANFFQKVGGAVSNFYYSFARKDDYTHNDPNVLNVWMQRGRDQVNLLQNLTNEWFTAQTGIKVKVNILPQSDILILANAAGIQPDVVLSVDEDAPLNFAMRDAAVDLSVMPGFDEVIANFAPGAINPFYYNGGYYGLPETQMFQVMYYRKDILNELGLQVPQTWDDVYEMAAVLARKQMNFYVNTKNYTPYFYQSGASFYTPDGRATLLDSPESFEAFKQWTDLFNLYGLEKEVPSFYQHFRDGSMPIGISDYNMYITMQVAAPELDGWWGIAPVPGILQPDGTIARWSGASAAIHEAGVKATTFGGVPGSGSGSGGNGIHGNMIYKDSEKIDQAWEFLKWWLSADVQERFGSDIEALNGVTFRYNTANVEAFTRLPWDPDDLQIMLEQWSWFIEPPIVPGGYFLPRELNNAWIRTVLEGMNYRTSLEMAKINIDRELARKHKEFGENDSGPGTARPNMLPVIDQPWEGVQRYLDD